MADYNIDPDTGYVIDPPLDQLYKKDWESLEEANEWFEWDKVIPEKLNMSEKIVTQHARHDKGKVAIFHENPEGERSKFTYWELERLSNRFANYLKNKGLQKGDRIAYSLPQGPEVMALFAGAWKLGCVVVPLTKLFGPSAIEYRLKDSNTKIAIYHEQALENLRKTENIESLEEILVVGDDIELKENEKYFEDALNEESKRFSMVETEPSDPSAIIYTSGTTGKPKGVLHDHATWYAYIPGILEFGVNLNPKPDDVFYCPVEWAWIGSIPYPAIVASFGKPIMTDGRVGIFDPERAFRQIEDWGLTSLYLVPAARRAMKMVENPSERYDLSSVRIAQSGGAEIEDSLVEWTNEVFPNLEASITGYGQTEMNILSVECPKLFEYRNNLGKPPIGTYAEIQDDDGNTLPPGEKGELVFKRTPQTFVEYWNKPEQTKNKFRGDWMLSEDIAIRKEDGSFEFVSRKDDVIITRGYRMGPGEIEDSLSEHEAVVEAGVIGIPDEEAGEVPKAFVSIKEDSEPTEDLKKELMAHVKERLAKHEYPREIEFIDEIPKTATMKVSRRDLKIREGLIEE